MKNPRLHRINNERFSVSLCYVAKFFKIRTVGILLDLVNTGNPKHRISKYNIRQGRIRNELLVYIWKNTER